MNFSPRAAWRPITVVVLVVGVLGSAQSIWQRHSLLAQHEAVLSELKTQPPPSVPGQPTSPSTARPEAFEEANKLITALQRPWEAMLNALQSALKSDVLLTRIQPETNVFRLRISGQADSSQAFLDFVQRLRADASWRVVEPLSEARQPDAGPGGKPLVFQLAVEWQQP